MTNNTFDYMAETVADIKDIDVEDIKKDTLIKELNFDSLDFVELQVAVKKKFDFTMNNNFFNEKTTFIEMCDYIDKRE